MIKVKIEPGTPVQLLQLRLVAAAAVLVIAFLLSYFPLLYGIIVGSLVGGAAVIGIVNWNATVPPEERI